MNCQQTRELLSAWVDGDATAAQRGAVEAHLATCAECRRELEHLSRTLTLLRDAEPPRAPAGFVDRVLARVGPAGRRPLLAQIFLPLGAKLPVEAAAIVMVAILVAYVARQAPEPAPPRAVLPSAATDSARSAELARPRLRAVGPSRSQDASVRPETGRSRRDADAERPAPPAPPAESTASGAPRQPDVAAKTAPPALVAPRAMNAAPAGGVLAGTLAVADRAGAGRELSELLRRLGGTEVVEHSAGGALVVEAALPEGAYAEFVRGLGRIGTWTPTQEPVGAPVRVRVTLKPAG
jgi:putative zinc finger protein